MKFYQLRTIIQTNNNTSINFFNLEHITYPIYNNARNNRLTNIPKWFHH